MVFLFCQVHVKKTYAYETSKKDDTPTKTAIQKGKSNTLTELSYSKYGDCTNGVYVENGVLVFTDVNHFKTTLECLEQQIQDNNQVFENQYGSLTDDQVADILETSNFNEFQPLIDFESSLVGYKSLRSKVEGQVSKWLNKPDLDMNTYPRNVSVIGQSMRTLVNESYQVKIGNQIIDLTVNSNGYSAFAPSSTCGMLGFSRDVVTFENENKKLVMNSGLAPALFGSTVGGEAYVYRKKNGIWLRYPTRINSQITGTLLTINCNFDQTFSRFDDVRNWASVNPRYRTWFRPTMMAQDYQIFFGVELPNFSVYRQMNVDVWY